MARFQSGMVRSRVFNFVNHFGGGSGITLGGSRAFGQLVTHWEDVRATCTM